MEPISAEHWKEGLLDLIAGLSEFPRSHPIVPEFIDFDVELRHAIYFSHRVVFKVSDKERIVSVVRVLHGGRNELFI
jgi:plasmid stabilization system protein ParE